MFLKIWLLIKLFLKATFFSLSLGMFFMWAYAFALPQSVDTFYKSVMTYPIYNKSSLSDDNYKIYLKHFTHNPIHSISDYNVKNTKKIINYLIVQSYRKDIKTSDVKKLLSLAHTLLLDLQEKYPFDIYLMVRKSDILRQKKQYIQAYNSLRASYDISSCYAPAMEYRITLKEKQNLFVANKIKNDFLNIQNKNCYYKTTHKN